MADDPITVHKVGHRLGAAAAALLPRLVDISNELLTIHTGERASALP